VAEFLANEAVCDKRFSIAVHLWPVEEHRGALFVFPCQGERYGAALERLIEVSRG